MDNKISLDTSNIYLMQPHASVDPLYGPYQSINDAVSALSEDYAEVVKPGLFFAVKDGDTYKQYIVNSLDPFDYEPAQTEQFVVGDSGSISWRVDSLNVNYADVKVGTGITKNENGVALNVGKGLTIGSDDSANLKLGSGVKFDLVDAVTINAGDGLQLESNGKLAILGSIIDAVQQLSSLSFGSGLRKTQNNEVIAYTDSTVDIDNSGRLCVSLSTIAGKGLMQSNSSILLNLGSGLRFNDALAYNSPVSVKIGTGLQFDSGSSSTVQLSSSVLSSIYNANVTYGNGLIRIGSDVLLVLGSGLGFDGVASSGCPVSVRIGTGLQFNSDDHLTVLISTSVMASIQNANVTYGNGLQRNGDQISVAVGSGLNADVDGLYVRISTGLNFDDGSDLFVHFDGDSIAYGNNGLYVNADNSTISIGSGVHVKLDAGSMQTTVNGISPKVDNASIVIGSDGIQSRGLIIKRKDVATQQYVVVGNTNNYSGQLILGSGVTAYTDLDGLHVKADLDFLDSVYQRIL